MKRGAEVGSEVEIEPYSVVRHLLAKYFKDEAAINRVMAWSTPGVDDDASLESLLPPSHKRAVELACKMFEWGKVDLD